MVVFRLRPGHRLSAADCDGRRTDAASVRTAADDGESGNRGSRPRSSAALRLTRNPFLLIREMHCLLPGTARFRRTKC